MWNAERGMRNKKQKTTAINPKTKFVFILVFSLLFVSCATVKERSPYSKVKPTKADLEFYDTLRIIGMFAGTVLGGTIGFLATQSENDGTKTVFSSAGGALAGTAVGWFAGNYAGEYMKENKTVDDKKLREQMDEYRMIHDVNEGP